VEILDHIPPNGPVLPVIVDGVTVDFYSPTYSLAVPYFGPLSANAFLYHTPSSPPSPPQISIADAVPVQEGVDTSAAFVVTLSAASTTPITVNFATQDGTGPLAAHAGKDYAAITNSLTFNPGEISKTISVGILSDGIIDGQETFSVTLVSNPSIDITRGQAFETINPSQGDVLGQNLNDLAGLIGQLSKAGVATVIGDIVKVTNDVYQLAHLDPATPNGTTAHLLFGTLDDFGKLLGRLEPGISTVVSEVAAFHDMAAQFALGNFATGFDELAKFGIVGAGTVIGAVDYGGLNGAVKGAAIGEAVYTGAHEVGVWLAHNWFDPLVNTIGHNLPNNRICWRFKLTEALP
jgi:hypothetical protein